MVVKLKIEKEIGINKPSYNGTSYEREHVLPSKGIDINWVSQKFGFYFRRNVINEMLIFSMTSAHWGVMTNLQGKMSNKDLKITAI